jgi:hypothetical protein
MDVVDVEKMKEGLGQIQSIMMDFDSDEWEIYRQSKGTWDKDFHRSYRNFTMEHLMKEREHLIKEKEHHMNLKEHHMNLKEHHMNVKELLMEKEILHLKLSLKEKGQ